MPHPRRLSQIVPAVAAAAVSLASLAAVQLALADGMERRPPPPVREAAAPPPAPEVPALLGAAPPCLEGEEAMAVIRGATEGIPIGTIQAALAQVNGAGAPGVDPEADALAQRLRSELHYSASSNCAPVTLALDDARQYAEVAADEPTGGIGPTSDTGRPGPLSPSNYPFIPPGFPEGANGTGYCHLHAPRCGRG